jgi:hypothetical protein
MANKVKTPKLGMGGNRHSGRSEKTEVLKEQSKVARRRTGLAELRMGLIGIRETSVKDGNCLKILINLE